MAKVQLDCLAVDLQPYCPPTMKLKSPWKGRQEWCHLFPFAWIDSYLTQELWSMSWRPLLKRKQRKHETPCHAHSLPVLSSPSHTLFSSVWSNTGTGFLKGWLVPYACSRDFWAMPLICFNFWLVLKCSGSWIRCSLMVLSRWIFYPVLFYSRNILLFYSRSILETS